MIFNLTFKTHCSCSIFHPHSSHSHQVAVQLVVVYQVAIQPLKHGPLESMLQSISDTSSSFAKYTFSSIRLATGMLSVLLFPPYIPVSECEVGLLAYERGVILISIM